MGRGDSQGSRQLSGLRRTDPRSRRALARTHQGRRRAGERRARSAGRRQGATHRRGRRPGRFGRAGRSVPDRRLPDRLRDLVEHERQRGHGSARRRGRAPERRREHGAVVERRLSVRRASGSTRRDHERPPACVATSRRVAASEGRRVRRRRQVRPHTSDGRGPGHTRAGVLGVCGTGAPGLRPRRLDPRAARAGPARRHRRRHGAEHTPRVRRQGQAAPRGGDRTADLCGRRPVRSAGRTRFDSSRPPAR